MIEQDQVVARLLGWTRSPAAAASRIAATKLWQTPEGRTVARPPSAVELADWLQRTLRSECDGKVVSIVPAAEPGEWVVRWSYGDDGLDDDVAHGDLRSALVAAVVSVAARLRKF